MTESNPITVFEFNGSSIRVCRSLTKKEIKNFKITSSRVVTHCFSFGYDIADPDISNKVATEIERHGVRVENAILSLPRYYAVSRFMCLPSVNKEELDKMVDMQLNKDEIHGRRSDLIYDYCLAGSNKHGYGFVNIFCIKRETADKYLKILNMAGIFPQKVTLNTQGILNWVIMESSCRASEINKTHIILNIDDGVFDFMAIYGESIVFSRTFRLPFGEFIDYEKWLAREIKVSYEMFRRLAVGKFEHNNEMRILRISSGSIRERGEKFIPWQIDESSFSDRVKQLSVRKAGIDISFASVLGLALGERHNFIDMTPDAVRRRTAGNKRWFYARKIIIRLSAAMFCFSLLLYRVIDHKITERNFLAAELKKYAISEARAESFTKFNFLQKEFIKINSGFKVLNKLYNCAPESLYIFDVMLFENGAVTINGFSKDMKDVLIFLDKLKSGGPFKSVKLDYLDTKEERPSREDIEFRIILNLNVSGVSSHD